MQYENKVCEHCKRQFADADKCVRCEGCGEISEERLKELASMFYANEDIVAKRLIT